jgi:hypothetical protein
MSNRGRAPRVKEQEREAYHSPPSNADVKHVLRFTTKSFEAFKHRCLGTLATLPLLDYIIIINLLKMRTNQTSANKKIKQ